LIQRGLSFAQVLSELSPFDSDSLQLASLPIPRLIQAGNLGLKLLFLLARQACLCRCCFRAYALQLTLKPGQSVLVLSDSALVMVSLGLETSQLLRQLNRTPGSGRFLSLSLLQISLEASQFGLQSRKLLLPFLAFSAETGLIFLAQFFGCLNLRLALLVPTGNERLPLRLCLALRFLQSSGRVRLGLAGGGSSISKRPLQFRDSSVQASHGLLTGVALGCQAGPVRFNGFEL
jgi:hypothetical protein